jgi:hypothetical protein
MIGFLSYGLRNLMPDDHHPLMPRRSPEEIDLGAIKADLEFLIERVSKLDNADLPLSVKRLT